MALRNIVKIDEEKCNGCGDCIDACAEGAIEIIDGKAKLISEIYCDGLGACLGHCPQDAITVEKEECAEFDEEATEKHLAEKSKPKQEEFTCPGMASRDLAGGTKEDENDPVFSLTHWPIQLKLVPPSAPFFADANLLLVADCVAFAMSDVHSRFIKDNSVVIGCPKLDDAGYYVDKLSEILRLNKLKSLTVIHMEVPCCFGLVQITKNAIEAANAEMSFEDVTIALDGSVSKSETVRS
jgi:NAD-dependent dihydropyrimidine dehydrogenase PreA subunit